MEYHGAVPTLEAEETCEAVLAALLTEGSWLQLDSDAIAEHIADLERYTAIPTIHRSALIDSYRLAEMTLSLINWQTRWQHVSKYQPHEYDAYSVHLLLHIDPTADAGHLMLRPETLADKVNEFFRRVELDFPGDRVFSRRHYVLAADEVAAERLLNAEVRSRLNAVPHAALESRAGSTLLAPLGVAETGLVAPLLQAGHAIAATA